MRRNATIFMVLALLCGTLPAAAGAITVVQPSAGAAGGGPLSGSIAGAAGSAPTDTTTTATTSSTASSGSLSTGVVVMMVIGGLVLIGGIAYLILRDARAAAPKRRGERTGPKMTQTPRADRVQRSRARAKAARQARKRTR
jgi:hypothetical protein